MDDMNTHSESTPVPRTDRRVQRTRKTLRDALMALIVERGYDTLTVQDITDRANMGRATFYLHYRDKEDLLIQSLQEVSDEMRMRLGGSTFTIDPSRPPVALLMFQQAAENRNLYRVMLTSSAAVPLMRRVRDQIANDTQQLILAMIPPEKLTVSVELASRYVAGALFELLLWWLEHDQPLPPETMAMEFRRITFGMFASLGIIPPEMLEMVMKSTPPASK
jgi:AcrR family transcriptional regulator